MIGDAKLLDALATVVETTKADGVSGSAHAGTRRVFRFANNAIHQDLTQESLAVTIKIVRGGRVGVASTNVLDPAGLTRCAKAAREIARLSPVQDDLAELPRNHRIRHTADAHAPTTRISPAACVTALQRLMHICQGAGARLAGSLITGADEFAVVNSNGVQCYAASTVAGAKLVTLYRRLSGFASRVDHDVDRLDLDGVLKRSLGQSLHRGDPVALPLGTYEVILEPEAVAELITWMGYTAFGAKSVQERTSFLAGRMGERVMGRQLTIYDDGNEPGMLRLPFDFEGSPRQKVVLIDRGRAAGLVFDTTYGARFGQPSTGHGMPSDEVDGPLPLHLAVGPGTSSITEMIRGCARGLLIPRFHYVNGLLNPRMALMTGLTREGTFLIEDGKITSPAITMRFTQSILEAFSHVLGVSKERQLIAEPSQELGCAMVPALHLAKFRFTGRSES